MNFNKCLLNKDSFNNHNRKFAHSKFETGEECPKFVNYFPVISTSASVSTELCDYKPFHCRWIDCKSNGFDSQISLVSHIERIHVESRREDFSCFWLGCPRRNRPFNARYKLLIHLRIHSGHKPNKCTFQDCTKAFSRLENLKIHLRSHTGERPYICTNATCLKSFSNSSDRAKHQRTHIDKKPYACVFPNCVKRYTDPSSLRKHAKIHNNIDSTYGIGNKIPVSTMAKSATKSKRLEINQTQAFLPLENSSVLLTPSSSTSDYSFEFPEIMSEEQQPQPNSIMNQYFESSGNYSYLDPFKSNLPDNNINGPIVKSEYFCPDLNYYYSDFDWMFYFELRDVDAILGD